MTEKVKLTQEQAEAIEYLKKGKFSDESIIGAHARNPNGWILEANVNLNRMPLLKLVDALRIGYEVEQQFKVGNWVVRKTNQEDERLPFRTGRVFKIKGFINGHYLDNEEFRHDSEALRYATSEEIKAEIERQLWKSIGREVGELKENDLVIYENKYFRLFKNMGCEIYGFHMDPVYASKLYGNGNLKGFYPAESFISFESVEEG
ncbi:hypothetical protein MKY29_12965 [Psychrobacillus sp. FSL K6-2365]|uniref:hypothetical protein n=1 Tax=Psychrobacillus sp. FSL K6-2365 TaxID=2921546 RepID=UPI0030F65C94